MTAGIILATTVLVACGLTNDQPRQPTPQYHLPSSPNSFDTGGSTGWITVSPSPKCSNGEFVVRIENGPYACAPILHAPVETKQ